MPAAAAAALTKELHTPITTRYCENIEMRFVATKRTIATFAAQ
jgi:hypothetical protein